jgi:hypothetical protein
VGNQIDVNMATSAAPVDVRGGAAAVQRIRAYHGGAENLSRLSVGRATNPHERAIFATNNADEAARFGSPYEVEINPSNFANFRWREFSDDPIYDPEIMRQILDRARGSGNSGAIISGVQNFEHGPRSTTYAIFDDALIDILRRYGLLGMLGGGAAATAGGEGG